MPIMIQNINLKLINYMYQDHQNIYILIVLNYQIKIMSPRMVIFIILFLKLLIPSISHMWKMAYSRNINILQ